MLLRRRDRLFERFCRTRDARALAGVFDLCAPELLRVATHLVGDRATAEDLVQSTFLQVIQDARAFASGRPVLPWLLGILANFARRHRREQRRRPEGEPVEAVMLASPLDAAERAELRESVAQALAALPATFRQILVLHLEHGLTAKEIAAVLEQPAGTVRTYVVRGMERLRRLLPAGLATGGAVVVSQERGLAAVRAEVLAAVGQGAGAGALTVAGWGLLGVLMAKQTVWIAGVVLIAAAAGSWWIAGGGLGARASTVDPALAAAAAPAASRAESRESAREGRVPETQASSPTAPGSLVVRVRYASDGAPAAHERLEIRRADSSRDLTPLVAELSTDADGIAHTDDVLGELSVETTHGASAVARVTGGSAVELTIEIPAGLTVEGEVVDHEQHPLPGASVMCPFERGGSGDACTLATTDDQGRFRLRDLPDRAWLWAESPGVRPSARQHLTFTPGGMARVRLVLGAPGHRLEGQVLDEDRSVVAHALVGIAIPEPTYESQGFKGYKYREHETRLVRAGADGRFSVDWVPPGELIVLAREPGFMAHRRGMARLVVATDRPNRMQVVMRRLPAVFGTVRDRQGRPLGDVSVRAFLHGWISFDQHGQDLTNDGTRTAADGTYRIPSLLPLPYELGAGDSSSLQVTQTLELADRQEIQWDPVLSAGLPLRVRIVDADGAPCTGWHVTWCTRTKPPYPPLSETAWESTDDEGRAASPPVKDASYWVLAYAPLVPTPSVWPHWDPFPTLVREDVHPSATEVTLTVRREQRPSVRLRGRIVGPDDRSVSGATVSWFRTDWKWGYGVFAFPVDLKTGAFDLGPVAPGTYALSFGADGWIGVRVPARTAAVDEVLDFGVLRLTPPAFVSVRWATPDGKPPKGALVLMGNGDSTAGTGWNDPSSNPSVWRSRALGAGTYRLFVRADGMAPIWREVTVLPGAREEIVVALEPGVPVPLELVFGWLAGGICNGTLHVRDAAGALVWEERLWGYFNDLTTGTLRRELSLRPGRYSVQASGPNQLRAELTLDVPAQGLAQPSRLTLR